MSEIAEFYNVFSRRQVAAGINNRHLSILQHLREAGFERNHRILEIGCGIGTVSELIMRYLSKVGFLHSVDISGTSIDLAKTRLKKYSNVLIEIRDLTKEVIDDKFDVVVLPDVIEHIPINMHKSLFENIGKVLKPEGFVFIHIPHPNNLEWMVNNEHEDLQIIDQPIYTDELCKTVYPLGFYVHFLKSYSIYSIENDYQIIILKPKPLSKDLTKLDTFYLPPFFQRISSKLRYLARGFK